MNLSRPGELRSASAISGSGGLNMGPGTYWPGLIDNVRIYNRAVTP